MCLPPRQRPQYPCGCHYTPTIPADAAVPTGHAVAPAPLGVTGTAAPCLHRIADPSSLPPSHRPSARRSPPQRDGAAEEPPARDVRGRRRHPAAAAARCARGAARATQPHRRSAPAARRRPPLPRPVAGECPPWLTENERSGAVMLSRAHTSHCIHITFAGRDYRQQAEIGHEHDGERPDTPKHRRRSFQSSPTRPHRSFF